MDTHKFKLGITCLSIKKAEKRIVNIYGILFWSLILSFSIFGFYCLYQANLWFDLNSNVFSIRIEYVKIIYFGFFGAYSFFLFVSQFFLQHKIFDILLKRWNKF